MSNRNLGFDQAWRAISDIASACREFNELQFKYRQLALSLVLAAYAAMGYFWLNVDGGNQKTEAAAHLVVSQQTMQGGGMDTGHKSDAPENGVATPQSGALLTSGESRPTINASAPDRTTEKTAVRTLTQTGRLYLILLGIGALTAFSGLAIYNLDGRYHRLLNANFEEGEKFEQSVTTGRVSDMPPMLQLAMARWMPSRKGGLLSNLGISESVSAGMLLFYMVGSGAALLPGIGFLAFHSDEIMWTVGSAWLTPVLVSEICVAALVVFFGVTSIQLANRPKNQQDDNKPTWQTGQSGAAASDDDQKLLELAHVTHSHAYAIHSNFKVGAAVLAVKDNEQRIFGGCNVENDSFGLTMCAERNAVAAAVAAGFTKVVRVVVFTDTDEVSMPCGACRQVIHQFGPDAVVVAYGREKHKRREMHELLPDAFNL